MCSLGIEPTTFRSADAMFYHWATQEHCVIDLDLDVFRLIITVLSLSLSQPCIVAECGEHKAGDEWGIAPNDGSGDTYPDFPEDSDMDFKDVIIFQHLHLHIHTCIYIKITCSIKSRITVT